MIALRFLPEFNNYGIEKSEIEKLTKQGILPEIYISPKDKKDLAGNTSVKATIGFLLGQDRSENGVEFYTVEIDYLRSMLRAGAEPRFLDYDNAIAQLYSCDGLILPGGSFDSPDSFYVKGNAGKTSKRANAYLGCTITAEKNHKPILGICAGAQMIGGLHGRKMYASIKDELKTGIEHKSKNSNAHDVFIPSNSPLAEIMQTSGTLLVNSRHNEAMIEDQIQKAFYHTDLEIYAVSKSDNIPEAWGNKEKNILCIQWHPENLATQNAAMQNIYNWLVDKSAETHAKQNKKIYSPLQLKFNQYE